MLGNNKTVLFSLLMRSLVLTKGSEERSSRAVAKREQILSGAKRVFLREGFAATSTDVIAREAGVSKRTLYAYYPSKEELFEDVLRELTVENPQTRVLESARRINPKSREELHEALLGLAKKLIATIMAPDYLALLRTIIADSHRFPKLSEIFRSTVPERGLREGSAMIQRSQQNGIAVDGDPEVMIRMFMGPLLSYALVDGLFRPDSDPQPPTTEKIEEIVELYVKAISAGE
ncbi:MAG: TetR/AcrR family transcriptional regulator [Rubrobacteraceae bacterium]